MNVKPHHPLTELIAQLLHGIESVPPDEQRRMVNRCAIEAGKWYESEVAREHDAPQPPASPARAVPEGYPATPQHDRLRAIWDQSQIIGGFLEWLTTSRRPAIHFCVTDGYYHANMTDLLAEYFEIDQRALEAEKRAILDYQRRINEQEDHA